uniref:Uncharacterized protein n=1 Tax=Arundo donax TaxID=35708 RepID=A0A0A9HR70_ARUDO
MNIYFGTTFLLKDSRNKCSLEVCSDNEVAGAQSTEREWETDHSILLDGCAC